MAVIRMLWIVTRNYFEGDSPITILIIDSMDITKTFLSILSFPAMWLNNEYIPIDWHLVNVSVSSFAIAACMTYNAAIIFIDWEKIYSVIDAVIFIAVDRLKNWWLGVSS